MGDLSSNNQPEQQIGAFATRITTTPSAEINALAYQGIIPSDCYIQISSTLARQLGPKYAALLAEPVPNRNGGFIDWYSNESGQVRRFIELPLEEREEFTKGIVELARDIRDFADKLILTHDPQKVTRGNLLKLALNYPSNEQIFIVGEQPVLVCWGFASGEMEAVAANLCDLSVNQKQATPIEQVLKEDVKVAPNVPEAQKSNVNNGYSFLPWFWPALLFLLLLLLLLVDWGGFAVRKDLTFFRFDHFYTIASCERVAELKEEIRHLEESIAAYDAKVRQYAALCVKKPAPIVSPKEPIGVEEKVQPREELVIPDEVVDTSFMHGRWLCDTGLINSTTLEPVQVEFVFDKNGNGTSTVYEKNDRCSGKAAATFENNILHMKKLMAVTLRIL